MAGNLEFIDSFEVTSPVSSFTLDNVFSDEYDVYCLSAQGWSGSNATSQLGYFRYLDSTGTVITSAEYDVASLVFRSNLSFVEVRATSNTVINYALGFYKVDVAPEQTSAISYIYNPYDSSSYTFGISQATGMNDGSGRGYKAISVHKSAETVRGFEMSNPSGNFTSGKMTVYGVK